jgi:hypothetical protein
VLTLQIYREDSFAVARTARTDFEHMADCIMPNAKPGDCIDFVDLIADAHIMLALDEEGGCCYWRFSCGGVYAPRIYDDKAFVDEPDPPFAEMSLSLSGEVKELFARGTVHVHH